MSSEHKGRKVTALCWDTAVLRVFVGDHMGKVSAIKLNTSKQAKVRTSPVLHVCGWEGVSYRISIKGHSNLSTVFLGGLI